MREFRHSAGSSPCFRTAFYAPGTFLEPPGTDGALPFVRASADGWPTAIASGTFDGVRCGSCGALLGAADVSAQATSMPIIMLAERRRAEVSGRHVRLTRALLEATEHPATMTAREIAEYLRVDPRGVTAAMESGDLTHAYRVGRRGGVGEWRCPWADGVHYIKRLEMRATDPAA
jgi:hypothetical protein